MSLCVTKYTLKRGGHICLLQIDLILSVCMVHGSKENVVEKACRILSNIFYPSSAESDGYWQEVGGEGSTGNKGTVGLS